MNENTPQNLFNKSHCFESTELNFKGRLMVLEPSILVKEYKQADYQLVYCIGGFGCSPRARGRIVYGSFLKDNEECQFHRSDFIGELKSEFLPDWAKQKLDEIRYAEQMPEKKADMPFMG